MSAAPFEAGCRFWGGPVLTLSFALEMSCVNSRSERKAAETFSGACSALAWELVRSGTIHAGFNNHIQVSPLKVRVCCGAGLVLRKP